LHTLAVVFSIPVNSLAEAGFTSRLIHIVVAFYVIPNDSPEPDFFLRKFLFIPWR
jgi:hypothetical protein